MVDLKKTIVLYATCSKCKKIKESPCFSPKKDKKNGLSSACKSCRRKDYSIAKALNPEKFSKERKDWRLRNLDKDKNAKLKWSYGISIDTYNTLFKLQEGCCKVCRKHQSEFKRALSVDHCHTTGKVRGLLCSGCNTALGHVKDNPDILKSLIQYLEDSKNG